MTEPHDDPLIPASRLYLATGFCQCGCGQRTPISARNDQAKGWVKGEPRRFIFGHRKRLDRGPASPSWKGGRIIHTGYVKVRRPDHPRAHGGYVAEHILVMESMIGRPIVEPEQVHHLNGDRTDNRPENLMLCPDDASHKALHRQARALAACGHADWRICTYCRAYDSTDRLRLSGKMAYHLVCARNYQRRRRLA